MTLSQKTGLLVILNNFGGKWVGQMRTVFGPGIRVF